MAAWLEWRRPTRGCRHGVVRPLLGLLLCVLFPCVAARAQTPEQGAETGSEPLPDRIQRAARSISDTLERLRLYPHVTSLATGGGAAPGFAYFDPAAGLGRVGLYGGLSHSVRGDSLYELRLGRMPHEPGRAPRRRLGFEWMPHFVTDPGPGDRFFFYGQARLLDLGAGRYLQGYSDPLRQESFDLVAGYRLAPGLAVQARAGVLGVSPGTGAQALERVFAASLDSPGLAWKRDYLRLTSELAWDTRIQPRHTQGGSFVSLRLESYQGLSGAPGFDRVALDARRFLPLGTPRHILALRAVGSYARTGGVPVPYYLQGSLGGGSLLRSFPEHRFSGDTLYALSAEYRFQALGWLQLAAFFDGGAASGGFTALNSGGFRTSQGVGVRLTTPSSVLFRFDVARGDEGTRFNAKIGYSF
jgi:hypothetical protein